MDKLQMIYAYVVTNWITVGPVAVWLLTNVANLITKRDPVDAGRIRRLINHISITTSADFPVWKMKMPFSAGPAHPGVTVPVVPAATDDTPPSPPPAMPPAVVLLLALGLALTSCGYCAVEAHKLDAKCVAENAVVTCGPSVIRALPDCVPYVEKKDFTGMFLMLGSKYPSIAGCVSTLINDLLLHSSSYDEFHVAHNAFIAKNNLQGITFKFAK